MGSPHSSYSDQASDGFAGLDPLSERKGGKHKEKRRSVKINVDLHESLLSYCRKKNNLAVKLVLEMFIEHGVDQDIFDPKWKEKSVKALEVENDLAGITVHCQALSKPEGENKDYKCVWYRDDAPPLIKKLGDTLEMYRAVCSACRRTGLIVEGFKERDIKIAELETELKGKAEAVFKVPKCNRGAVLHHDKEDQLIMTNCFRHRGEPVSVDKFCRIQARGLPCSFFAFLVVGVEGKNT